LPSLNYLSKNIEIIAAIYPAVWGIGQIFADKMTNVYSKKKLI
jgi:hypothetical protein